MWLPKKRLSAPRETLRVGVAHSQEGTEHKMQEDIMMESIIYRCVIDTTAHSDAFRSDRGILATADLWCKEAVLALVARMERET